MFNIQFELSMQFLEQDGDKVGHQFVLIEQYNLRIEKFENNGTGLLLERINGFKFMIMDIENLISGAKLQEIPEILRSKCFTLVKVPSHDNFCIKRCALAHINDQNSSCKG